MKQKNFFFAIFILTLITAQLACNLPSDIASTPDPFATLNGLYTAAAQTQAIAGTATPGLPQPTVTLAGSATATNPAITQAPAKTTKCDSAQFLADVTYPDGSLVPRNTTFVKIWRIRNNGTCTWSTSYSLVPTGGDGMGAPGNINIPGSVAPGQYIEVPVAMVSPSTEGNYRGYWKLRNAAGNLFGIGDQADTSFWVDIRVAGPSFIAYNFAENYCQAEWTNGSAALPCPGTEGNSNGYILRLPAPLMENGTTEDEPGLLTVPKDQRDGLISGLYPALTIQAGDRFRTIVNCQRNATNCNVIFRLDYLHNGALKTYASWAEVYEGKYYPVDLDLSPLSGQNIRFLLTVITNGSNNQDYAIWLNPHIIRQGTAPTNTFTPSPTFTGTPSPTATFTLTPTLTSTPSETPTP